MGEDSGAERKRVRLLPLSETNKRTHKGYYKPFEYVSLGEHLPETEGSKRDRVELRGLGSVSRPLVPGAESRRLRRKELPRGPSSPSWEPPRPPSRGQQAGHPSLGNRRQRLPLLPRSAPLLASSCHPSALPHLSLHARSAHLPPGGPGGCSELRFPTPAGRRGESGPSPRARSPLGSAGKPFEEGKKKKKVGNSTKRKGFKC